MSSHIYFDEAALSRGNFFDLNSEISTEEGNSYELEEWLGRGGNAAVFLGRQRVTGEECAIKFLMNTGLKSQKRFVREIRLLSLIHGDHITRYHGAGHVTVTHNKRRPRDNQLPL